MAVEAIIMAREIHYTALIVSMLTGALATLVVMAALLGLGTPGCGSAETGATAASTAECPR